MATDIPYAPVAGNIPAIFEKIKSAGAPPRFTNEFLRTSLGFTSSNDRAVIKILKALAFLDSTGTPTPRYHEFRDSTKSGRSVAAGLREGWADIFLSDEQANTKNNAELTSIFQSVTGRSESVAAKMAATFRQLVALADFGAVSSSAVASSPDGGEVGVSPKREEAKGGRALTLHQDVHVHLPPTTDVAVYAAIFRAMKDELLD